MNNKSFIFVGRIYKNCGHSQGQSAALQNAQGFSSFMQNAYKGVFSNAQNILSSLTTNLSTMANKFFTQGGFTPVAKAGMESQALNEAAAANQQVQQAIGENAGKNTAAPGVESGIVQAERAQASTQIEGQLANRQTDIEQKNAELGTQYGFQATQQEMAAPGAILSPATQIAGVAEGAVGQESSQANANAAGNNQWMGLVEGLAGDAAKAFAASQGGSKNSE